MGRTRSNFATGPFGFGDGAPQIARIAFDHESLYFAGLNIVEFWLVPLAGNLSIEVKEDARESQPAF
jgi:hypothetical protein